MNKPQGGRLAESFFVPVSKFSKDQCPFSNRNQTWQQFHTFRNAVLEVLGTYGTVGPTGKLPILDTYEESELARPVGIRNPDFFVVDDDMYGMSVRVEAACTLAKPVLLEELVMLLKLFQEWCVYLALVKGGLWVFHDRILYEGQFFAGCASVQDIYNRVASSKNSSSNI